MGTCCPVIRVKCPRRKTKGKLVCTVRMAGQKWRRTPEKAQQKVNELVKRLHKKDCRGTVIGVIPSEHVRVQSGGGRQKMVRRSQAFAPATPVTSFAPQSSYDYRPDRTFTDPDSSWPPRRPASGGWTPPPPRAGWVKEYANKPKRHDYRRDRFPWSE